MVSVGSPRFSLGGSNATHGDVPARRRNIVLLGNLGVGKSALFERLCDRSMATLSDNEVPRGHLRSELNGWPDMVPCGAGGCRGCGVHAAANEPPTPRADRCALLGAQLTEAPGASSIFVNNGAEGSLVELLLSDPMDGIIVVLDAKNLRRSLALALEVAELGVPMLLDLNMIDEAENLGIHIDDDELAALFGVPICRTVAIDGVGVRGLCQLLPDARLPSRNVRFPKAIENALCDIEEVLPNGLSVPLRALGLLLLAGDSHARSWIDDHLKRDAVAKIQTIVERAQEVPGSTLRAVIAGSIHAEAERIAQRVAIRTNRAPTLLTRFGRLAQRPLSGAVIAAFVVVVAYLWIGAFAATFVVDSIDVHLFQDFLVPFCESIVAKIPMDFVRDAIMDHDFGLLPAGLFLAVGIVLPVLFAFYLLHGVLDDSGYLPRLAVLFDRLFRKIGLNGQALIPLVLGFSCVTMAVITTRMLATRKERIILTLLLCMGIPCAPLLAVMIVLLSPLPWTASAVVFGVIALQIVVSGFAASKIIKGKLSDLILELPPMRVPRITRVLRHTWARTWLFMREAVPLFLLASFVMFLFHRVGGLDVIESAARPLTQSFLGLPDQAVQVFLKTAIRRENGATELRLLRDYFDNVQLVVALVVMSFLVPCINAALVVLKERGVKTGIAILSASTFWAILLGALLNLVLRNLGVSFA